MKKLLKKLKKNQLLSKIAALFTICMILLSSFTVSSFAADEDESTNSITEVWTGVTDSIMSLLGTAQGVFVSSGETYSSSVVLLSDSYYYPDLPYLPDGTTGFLSLPGDDPEISALYPNGIPFLVTYFPEDEISIMYITVEGYTAPYLVYRDFPSSGFDTPFWGAVDVPSSAPETITLLVGDSSLTFLGTLAVIGVALSIILLLVFVISRFIHLRG